MVFVTTGLGGGTGTGAAPIVASLATEIECLDGGCGSLSRSFRRSPAQQQAENGLRELHECVDTVITIANERLCMRLIAA